MYQYMVLFETMQQKYNLEYRIHLANETKLEMINIPQIKDIHVDSRRCTQNSIFVVREGFKQSAVTYIVDAYEKGVRIFITSDKSVEEAKELIDKQHLLDVLLVQVEDSNEMYSALSHTLFNFISESMDVIAVSGTDGKTTVSTILYEALQYFRKPILIGTNGIYFNGEKVELEHTTATTPESYDIFHTLDILKRRGADVLVIEVTSHAIAYKRTQHLDIDYCIHTIITSDHLDFHGTLEAYEETKYTLYRELKKEAVLFVNLDDPKHGEKIAKLTRGTVQTYSTGKSSDICISDIDASLQGIHFSISTPKTQAITIHSKLLGTFNALNLGVSFAVLETMFPEHSDKEYKEQLEMIQGINGRMVNFPYRKGAIIIDYAHTVKGMRTVLEFVREYTKGNIHVVFGSAGDRDRQKRPFMGKVVSEITKNIYLTFDDPRDEDPKDIAKDIAKGISFDVPYYLSRQEAIEQAISNSEDEDAVIIFGKGNDAYHYFPNNTKHYLNDIDIVSSYLKK